MNIELSLKGNKYKTRLSSYEKAVHSMVSIDSMDSMDGGAIEACRDDIVAVSRNDIGTDRKNPRPLCIICHDCIYGYEIVVGENDSSLKHKNET